VLRCVSVRAEKKSENIFTSNGEATLMAGTGKARRILNKNKRKEKVRFDYT